MEPRTDHVGRKEIILATDYGIDWPLSDIMWRQTVDWPSLITAELIERLKQWADFFTANADEKTGSFGSEEKRKWFDQEGVALLNELDAQVGTEYKVILNLWF